MKLRYGTAGIALGTLCIGFLLATEAFGLRSNMTSGSTMIYADGTMNTVRPLFPLLVQSAFFICFLSLLFGIVSLVRGESKFVSFGAIAFGVAPICYYFTGLVITFFMYFGLILPIVGLGMYKVLARVSKPVHSVI